MKVAMQVVELLRRHAFHWDDEADLQAQIEAVLKKAKLAFRREVWLSDQDRIDFLLEEGCGIEVKVDGGKSDVARQLIRYMESDKITTLILVTAKVRLGRLPQSLLNKPLFVVPLWRSCL